MGSTSVNLIATSGGGYWITTSWSGRLYLLIRASQSGTTVNTGVYTYDPNQQIPSNARELVVNDVRTSDDLLSGQDALYYFQAKAGYSYEIKTKTSSGSVSQYAGKSPEVSSDNCDKSDYHADNGIELEYADDMTVFIRVIDQNTNLGSEYTIRVVSYNEASAEIADVQPLVVNDERTIGTLMPHQVKRFSFHMGYGNQYRIIPATESGSFSMYASELSCVDEQVYEKGDYHADNGIELLASESAGTQYIAVVDTGTDLGTEFSVRVISYDESNPMLPNTELYPGSTLENQSLNPGGLLRYQMTLSEGSTYRIHIKTESGSVSSYLSSISSVDEQVNEKGDYHADNDIVFLSQQTDYYYVAVVDQNTSLGSVFSITLTEE